MAATSSSTAAPARRRKWRRCESDCGDAPSSPARRTRTRIASGGTGGDNGLDSHVGGSQTGNGGGGGPATALATGQFGKWQVLRFPLRRQAVPVTDWEKALAGFGGDASARSTAKRERFWRRIVIRDRRRRHGSFGIDWRRFLTGGSATATANASATGGGKAIATAVATPGIGQQSVWQLRPGGSANATSNAETVNGAMAQALSTAGSAAVGAFAASVASSIAKTSLGGVSAHRLRLRPYQQFRRFTAKTDAIAQGGSGPTSLDPEHDHWRHLDRPSRQGLRYDADR